MKKRHEPYVGLKSEFIRRGLVYKTVAAELCISVPTLCHKITGISDFTLSEVKRIYELYGIDSAIF